MAYYEPVEVQPTIGLEDDYIVTAATVLGRMTRLGRGFLHVADWQAGVGQEVRMIDPAEFESWRRQFVRPVGPAS